MTPERHIIEMGLTKLHRYIYKLHRVPGHRGNQQGVTAWPETREQTFRRLVVLATNVANHIIARLKLPPPSDPLELFAVLSQAGVLPGELAGRLRGVALLRASLVHGYQQIPSEEVRAWIPHRLDDFTAFAQCAEAILLGR